MRFVKQYLPEIIGGVILLLYLSPNIFFPQHAHYLVHDNLDSDVVWNKMLADDGLVFSSANTIFPNIYGGIPRGCMTTDLDIWMLLNIIFSPLVAYNINIILIHVIAFIGTYKLLGDYVFKGVNKLYFVLLSVGFALIPFWPTGELAVAGQPLLIWTFLNFFSKDHSLKNWLILILMPFYASDFTFSNLFFAPILLLFIMAYSFVKRERNIKPFLGWTLYFALCATVEYRLFIMQFVDHLQSQRTSFESSSKLNFNGYLGDVLCLFFKGQYHFYPATWFMISVPTIIGLFFVTNKQRFLINSMLFCAIISSALFCFHFWQGSATFFKLMGPLQSLQLRFITVIPFAWYFSFAIVVWYLLGKNKILNCMVLGYLITEIVLSLFNVGTRDYQGDKYTENSFYYTYFVKNNYSNQSFTDYYTPKAFTELKKKINYNHEVVLCLGFPSEKAQYNDIYTAAAYYQYFPEAKREKLVNIFKPELNKIPDSLLRLQIATGRRFQYYYNKINGGQIEDLQLDEAALGKMDVKYVLSAYPIANNKDLGFTEVSSVDNSNSLPNHIYIYSVSPKAIL
jgi:hypothetical protein